MSLSIKNPLAEQLAREVAKRSGETLTQAVIAALQERLERLSDQRRVPDLADLPRIIAERSRRSAAQGLLHEASIDAVSMDLEQVALAREAYGRFGRGRHAAGLNLGDCCAYALARQTGEPLLFKGSDFTQTDVRPAEY